MDTNHDFSTGMTVVYGLHGKCSITGIETRQIQGQEIPFYKLEIQKSSFSRSSKKDPAIWLPVSTAREQGLRHPLTKIDAEAVMGVIQSREYFFPVKENWSTIQHKLEACIRHEGGSGLAKVASYLYVLKKRMIILPTEINRFQETVMKLLIRELSEAFDNKAPKIIESQINKAFAHKLMPDA